MKILIIHTAFIGDIVLSTPLIDKLAKTYEGATIDYLTVPAGAAILKNNPHLRKIIPYDKKGKNKGWKEFWKLGMSLRAEGYDMVVCPHRYLRSMLLMLLCGAKKRVAYKTAPLAFFATKEVPYDKAKHEVEKLLSFVEGEKGEGKIALYPGEADKEFWRKKKEAYGLHKHYVVLAIGSRWETKRWPLEYFQEVLDNLEKDPSVVVVLVGSKEEKKLQLSFGEKIMDLRGETSLLELTAVLQDADVIVSNDSSPLHIASSSEKAKIIAIFGPTVRSLGFTPWSKHHVILEEDLDCRPCGLHGSHTCPQKHFHCMRDLKPARVLREIRKDWVEDEKTIEKE